MQRIRLFLLNLIAGKQTIVLNAHIKGTIVMNPDQKGIIYNSTILNED